MVPSFYCLPTLPNPYTASVGAQVLLVNTTHRVTGETPLLYGDTSSITIRISELLVTTVTSRCFRGIFVTTGGYGARATVSADHYTILLTEGRTTVV